MSKYAEILAKLKGLQAPIISCIPATIKSIDTESTCTVILPDGMEIPDVRLKAANDGKKEFLLVKPREKSSVLLGMIGDDESASEYFIEAFNEIDEVVLKIKDLEFLATKDGISLNHKDAKFEIVNNSISLIQNDTKLVLDTESALLSYKNNLVKIENNEIQIQGTTGVHLNISSNGISMKQVVKSVLDCIQNLKVTVAGGVGMPEVTTMANVTAAALKIEQLFS